MPRQMLLVLSLLIPGCRGEVERKGTSESEVPAPALAQGHVANDSATQALCTGMTNNYKCAQTVEASLLQPMEGTIDRSDRRLRIALENGDSIVLVDAEGDDPDGVWYSYRGLLAAVGYHVIELQYFEGGGYLLVNQRTGWSTRGDGVPTVSPDSARLAAGNVDLEARYSPTTLQIWVVSADTLRLEFEHDFVRAAAQPDSVWGPRRVEWITPKELRMTREFGSGVVNGTARAVLGSEGWRLAPK